MINPLKLEQDIINWLNEDMPYGDITTSNIEAAGKGIKAELIAKEDGIICGLDVAKKVFDIVDSAITCNYSYQDGDTVKKGDLIGIIDGNFSSILMGERVALNLMQRMSGIATLAYQYSDAVLDLNAKVVDTRKTTPGLRYLEKYAVLTGGCHNHRYSLSDAVMIKDNHIKLAGGIKEAVNAVKAKIPFTTLIEVEVETLEDYKVALDSDADIIMLDNMTLDMMKEAVELNKGKVILEASGNVTLERVRDIALTGVDIISVGALTHSVKALDISLKFKI